MGDNPLIIIPAYIRTEREYEYTYTAVSTAITYGKCKVVVVDDKSPFSDAIDRLENADINIIRKSENSGFSSTVNYGLRLAHEEKRDVILMNADIELLDDEWLPALYESKGDIAGGMLLYPNNLIQSAGTYFSLLTRNFAHRYQWSSPKLEQANRLAICPVTAALQLIKWEVLDKIGLYDEDLKMGWEDVEYAIRAEYAGFKSVYTPHSRAIHHESVFRGTGNATAKKWNRESWITFHKKLAGVEFKWVPLMLGENTDGCKTYRESIGLR